MSPPFILSFILLFFYTLTLVAVPLLNLLSKVPKSTLIIIYLFIRLDPCPNVQSTLINFQLQNMYPHLSTTINRTRDTQRAQSGVAATYLGNTNKNACFADPPCAIDILRPRPTPFFQVPIQPFTHTDCCAYSASDITLVPLHPGKQIQAVTGAPAQ